MSKTFPEKILRKSTKISMSVFPRLFFVLLCFQVLLSDGSSKTLQKTLHEKKSCRKVFTKNRQKIQNRFCFITFFGRFSMREFKNTTKKLTKNLTSPDTFLASEEPTNHPKVRQPSHLFLRAPRGAAKNKIDGPPRTFAKSQTPPPPIRLFFP
jgi:hypothetical protein